MLIRQVSSSWAVDIKSSSTIPLINNKSSATATSSFLSTHQRSKSDVTAEQQYSNIGAAATGFGQQLVMDGSEYGASQKQTATARAAGLTAAENKSHYRVSSTMTKKQPTAGLPAAGTFSKAYNDANNSFQLGVNGQYQNGGYQSGSCNQALKASGYKPTGYGSTAHQSIMSPCQVRESETSAGDYQPAISTGYQQSIYHAGVAPQAPTTAASTQSTQEFGRFTDSLSMADGQEVLGFTQYDAVSTNSSFSTGIMSSAGLPASTILSPAIISPAAVTKSSTPVTGKSSERWCCVTVLVN